MADIALSPNWAGSDGTSRRGRARSLAHRAAVLRRLARRERYRALVGRSARRYPWFETLFTSMSSR